ncbi:hypothetical protein GC093_05205 [Paenibacillus sp. LMG 31456]|uniref:Uncharacterized protein n=1 Tax=Paenibacillus foliorum TaxID=2654974 RepID=A0A972GRR6_9BACL|nr:hypothetical protein [Paenibacillus foliorum]NOU92627.1 hypothetical protein [Paenibacillus foliorum]
MKPALEKFLLIAATLAAIGLFVFIAMWSSIKEKKTQMDDLFNNTNVPSSFYYEPLETFDPQVALSLSIYSPSQGAEEINSSRQPAHSLVV